jgi:hypothetical protein
MLDDDATTLLWPSDHIDKPGGRTLEAGEQVLMIPCRGVWYEVLYLPVNVGRYGKECGFCPHCHGPMFEWVDGATAIELKDVLVLDSSHTYHMGEARERLPLDSEVARQLCGELLLGHQIRRSGCLTEGCPGSLQSQRQKEPSLALWYEVATHK